MLVFCKGSRSFPSLPARLAMAGLEKSRPHQSVWKGNRSSQGTGEACLHLMRDRGLPTPHRLRREEKEPKRLGNG